MSDQAEIRSYILGTQTDLPHPPADSALDALDRLESQNQVFQERIEAALKAMDERSPFFVELREILSPTQKTDRPENEEFPPGTMGRIDGLTDDMGG